MLGGGHGPEDIIDAISRKSSDVMTPSISHARLAAAEEELGL